LNAGAAGDPAVRDRDFKLLAWLEYSEMLVDGQYHTHFATRSELTGSR
jgi:hypothetical protein